MRIIFMGTPDFAVPSLQILLEQGYEVAAVVTAPDKPGGRMGILQSAVKQFATVRSLRVLQPAKLRDPLFLEELRALQADLQVVVAFRMLPELVWNMPPMGTMNLHGSLLPKYRGAAPINWAIIRGEVETGVSTFLLQHEIDTGDLLLQQQMPIGPDETAGEVHDRMMLLGADLVLESVRRLEKGELVSIPQEAGRATHAPKLSTETCRIDFNQAAITIHNFIRGLSPYPGAWTKLDDKVLKILRSKVFNTSAVSGEPGVFYSDGKHYLRVGTAAGYIDILELQLEGKKRVTIHDFLNGYKKNWKNSA